MNPLTFRMPKIRPAWHLNVNLFDVNGSLVYILLHWQTVGYLLYSNFQFYFSFFGMNVLTVSFILVKLVRLVYPYLVAAGLISDHKVFSKHFQSLYNKVIFVTI